MIHKIKSCCRRRPECIGIRTNCGKYLYSPHILCYCFLASGADSETAYMIPQLSFGSARRGCVKGCPLGIHSFAGSHNRFSQLGASGREAARGIRRGRRMVIARMRKTNLVEFDNIRNCERRRFLWIRMLLRKFRRQLSLLRSI